MAVLLGRKLPIPHQQPLPKETAAVAAVWAANGAQKRPINFEQEMGDEDEDGDEEGDEDVEEAELVVDVERVKETNELEVAASEEMEEKV